MKNKISDAILAYLIILSDRISLRLSFIDTNSAYYIPERIPRQK